MKEIQAIKRFKRFLQIEKGLSPNSIYSYTYDLKKFCEFLSRDNKDVLTATQDDIVKFLKFEKNKKHNSSRTLAQVPGGHTAILQFHLRYHGRAWKIPPSRLKRRIVKKTLPDFLTIRRRSNELFTSISESDLYELRDKSIFELLYSCGLRISEAVELNLSDVDFENRFLSGQGKGRQGAHGARWGGGHPAVEAVLCRIRAR